MPFDFKASKPPKDVTMSQWQDWTWQFRNALKSVEDFKTVFELTDEELLGFEKSKEIFRAQTTPYYASLVQKNNSHDPIRKISLPHASELSEQGQQQLDPLGERKENNRPSERIVHRYSDRVLFLITDLCSVYCRYCTRKHFTATDQAFLKSKEYQNAIEYIKSHPGVREVIFSGGDPLTISDHLLDRVLSDIRSIDHIEIIRLHTRMPVVCPMRVTDDLVSIIKKNKPVYVITHFNHPKEITLDAAQAVENLVDNGTPVLNQMVLLNGINNHEAIVQALSRRLLYLRVKPYYMFQCDPSRGTEHFRTSIDDSLHIQKQLWGHLSGLAMPNYIVDIPDGGGKMAMTPNFETSHEGVVRTYIGWDGVEAQYISPEKVLKPIDAEDYMEEWQRIRSAKF